MSKFDQITSGPDKSMDDQVTKWLQDNEDKLSADAKEYSTYDPSKGDHQVFDAESNGETEVNSKEGKLQIGALAVDALENNHDSIPEPLPTPPIPVETPFDMQ